MAENKKSVLLYCDIIHTVSELTNEEAGILFKHYLSYINDLNPIAPDKLTQIVFEPIKQNLKRDLKKWEAKVGNFSEAGKISVKAKRLINQPQLYIIKLYNDNEAFIKVGVTDFSVSRRFRSSGDGMSKLGYKFDVLYQYFKSDYNVSLIDVESAVGNKFRDVQYLPKNKFGGYLECYEIDYLEDIKLFCDKMFNVVKYCSTISTVNDTVKDNDTDIVKVKDINKNTVSEIWFKDLENSTYLERIAMDNKLTIQQVKNKLPEFKPKMNIEYKTFNDLVNHFKNWIIKNKTEQPTIKKRNPLV